MTAALICGGIPVPSFAPAVGGHFETKEATMTTTAKLTEADLNQFTGSENWYRHGINRDVLFTDGAKHVADEGGAYWLLDAIAIAQRYEKKVATEEFQVWTLKVREDRTASLFTDFPLDEITLRFAKKAIYLPSEH